MTNQACVCVCVCVCARLTHHIHTVFVLPNNYCVPRTLQIARDGATKGGVKDRGSHTGRENLLLQKLLLHSRVF